MTNDRDPALVSDMLAFVRELRALVGPLDLRDYLSQRVLNLAVEKLFINMGEAAQRLSDEAKRDMPLVPWRRVTGLRNILAHGYEPAVDHETLFRTVQQDLAEVERALGDWLAALGPDA